MSFFNLESKSTLNKIGALIFEKSCLPTSRIVLRKTRLNQKATHRDPNENLLECYFDSLATLEKYKKLWKKMDFSVSKPLHVTP